MVNLGTPTKLSSNTGEDSGALVNSVSWSEAKTGYFESLRASQGEVKMKTVVNRQWLRGLTLTSGTSLGNLCLLRVAKQLVEPQLSLSLGAVPEGSFQLCLVVPEELFGIGPQYFICWPLALGWGTRSVWAWLIHAWPNACMCRKLREHIRASFRGLVNEWFQWQYSLVVKTIQTWLWYLSSVILGMLFNLSET